MSEETDGQTVAPGEAPAQVDEQQPEATAGTDGAEIPEDGDESAADTEGEAKKPAKGVQKRLDELTRRIHEERREKERLYALLERQPQQGQPAPVAQTDNQPREEDFPDYDAYMRALGRYEARQEIQQERQQEQREQSGRAFQERIDKVRDKLPDYDLYVGDPTLPITPLMAEVIRESDVGPEVAYHLGKNRSEAERIARLPPHRQAAELGRLEARLSAPQAQSHKPTPPAPPQTVTGLSAGLAKAPQDMSMDEYKAWREANP